MKQKLEPRIEAAATCLKIAGKKAMQHPIPSILSVCKLAGVTATIVTYSQTPEAPVAEAVAPLALPANTVELVDVNGRKITVTVLSMAADKQSIIIRLADGREMPFPMNRLHPDSIIKLMGITRRKPVAKPQQIPVRELAASAFAAIKATRDLPVNELHKLYVARDPKVMPHIELIQHSWQEATRWYDRDQTLKTKSVNPLTIISAMEVKAPGVEEKVSLRPEFERLGVKAAQQVGNSCSTYSAQHLMQYAFRSAGMTPPTVETLMKLTIPDGVKVPPPLLLRAAAQVSRQSGKVPSTLEFNAISCNLSPQLFNEMVKHQIRNKRAVITGDHTNAHAIVIVGFYVKDGKTTWEYLDSNRVWQDKGFKTEVRITESAAFSLWFD